MLTFSSSNLEYLIWEAQWSSMLSVVILVWLLQDVSTSKALKWITLPKVCTPNHCFYDMIWTL